MRVRTVEIEFVEDQFGEDGDIARGKGDRFYVDQMSAHSLVDIKKVARRVADGPVLSTNKRVPKRKPKPEPAPGADSESEPDEPDNEVAGV